MTRYANDRLIGSVSLKTAVKQAEYKEISKLVSAVVFRVKGVELSVGYFRFANPEPACRLIVESPFRYIDEFDCLAVRKRYRFGFLTVKRFLYRNRRRRISIGIERFESSVNFVFWRKNGLNSAGNVRIENALLILN